MNSQARQYLPLAFLLVIAAVAFFFTLPVTLPDGDSGEYLLKGLRGGIIHPPGYPLYYILLRAISPLSHFFPIVPLFAFFSSIFSLLAAVFVYRLSFELSKNSMSAFIAAGGVLFASWCWRSFINIEPYGLHAILVTSCMYFSYKTIQASSAGAVGRYSVVLGVIFGLGFCHHHSLVFLLPATLVAVIWSARKKTGVLKGVFLFGIGGLIGLAPLLVFFFADPAGIFNWGDWQDFWPRFWQHLSRAEYSSAEIKREDWTSYINISIYFYQHILGQLSFVLGIPLVVGAVVCIYRRDLNDRMYLSLLGLSLFLSTFVFLGALNLPTDDANVMVFSRFFAMPVLLLAPFIAIGWTWIADRLTRFKMLPIVSAYLFLGFHMMYQLSPSDRSSERFVERHITNILSIVPDGSVILTKHGIDYQGLMYGLHVLNVKKDVAVIQPPMWNAPWYRKKIVDSLGLPPEAANYQLEFILNYLMNERPIFATTIGYQALSSYAAEAQPIGPIFRLDNLKQKLSAEELYRINVDLYDSIQLVPKQDELEHLTLWEWLAMRDYYESWMVLSNRLRAGGLTEIAEEAQQRASKLKPPYLD